MTNDFDKEIDSLLRQTARKGEAAFNGENPLSAGNAQSLHVNADEISLFAENALPVKMRAHVTEHLADCDRCRKILSNVIAFNSEAVSENVHVTEITSSAASIPWYKKLFVFPQIAYVMGALVLVFSGVIALMVLQNSTSTLNPDVAQKSVQERREDTSNSSSVVMATPETYTMSNTTTTGTTGNTSTSNSMTAMANTSMNSSIKQTAPLSSAANSNSSLTTSEEKVAGGKLAGEQQLGTLRDSKTVDSDDIALAKPVAPIKRENVAKDGPPTKTDNEYRIDKRQVSNLPSQQAEIVQSPSVQNQISIMPDTQNARRSPPASRAESSKSIVTESADGVGATKNKAAETRTASGKVFKRSDGAWYDSAYKGGATTNIRRGTSEYKKLDKGLQSIAESIGGVIVVVWKGKAYRIQ